LLDGQTCSDDRDEGSGGYIRRDGPRNRGRTVGLEPRAIYVAHEAATDEDCVAFHVDSATRMMLGVDGEDTRWSDQNVVNVRTAFTNGHGVEDPPVWAQGREDRRDLLLADVPHAPVDDLVGQGAGQPLDGLR
jgi:hypothetical protein